MKRATVVFLLFWSCLLNPACERSKRRTVEQQRHGTPPASRPAAMGTTTSQPVSTAPASLAVSTTRSAASQPAQTQTTPTTLPTAIMTPGVQGLKATRISICEQVEEREPVNALHSVSAETSEIYCHIEFTNAPGPRTIVVRWIHGSQVVQSLEMQVPRGARYRTWARHRLGGTAAGTWACEAIDKQTGTLLARRPFIVVGL